MEAVTPTCRSCGAKFPGRETCKRCGADPNAEPKPIAAVRVAERMLAAVPGNFAAGTELELKVDFGPFQKAMEKAADQLQAFVDSMGGVDRVALAKYERRQARALARSRRNTAARVAGRRRLRGGR